MRETAFQGVVSLGAKCLILAVLSPFLFPVLYIMASPFVGGNADFLLGLMILSLLPIPTALLFLGVAASAYGVLRRNPKYGTRTSLGVGLVLASAFLGITWPYQVALYPYFGWLL